MRLVSFFQGIYAELRFRWAEGVDFGLLCSKVYCDFTVYVVR